MLKKFVAIFEVIAIGAVVGTFLDSVSGFRPDMFSFSFDWALLIHDMRFALVGIIIGLIVARK